MASIVTVNKAYARNRFVDKMYARNRICYLPYQVASTVIMSKPYMSAIGFVDKMYERNRLCYLTISRSKTYVSYRFC